VPAKKSFELSQNLPSKKKQKKLEAILKCHVLYDDKNQNLKTLNIILRLCLFNL
jgi:hypothetical protein